MRVAVILIVAIFATVLLVNYAECSPADSELDDDSFAPLEPEAVLNRQKRQFGYGGGRGFGGGGFGGRGFGGGGYGRRGFGGGGYGRRGFGGGGFGGGYGR